MPSGDGFLRHRSGSWCQEPLAAAHRPPAHQPRKTVKKKFADSPADEGSHEPPQALQCMAPVRHHKLPEHVVVEECTPLFMEIPFGTDGPIVTPTAIKVRNVAKCKGRSDDVSH